MSETSITANPSARGRSSRRIVALAAVVLVPLAFAGLLIGAVANADDRIDHIPAIVVNDDRFVTQTATDGTKTQVLAGRQLVTELTGGDAGFDWQISNDADAAAALADGSVYAVLTIPSDFSASIVSLQSDAPRQASFTIATDDAHDYIGGAVAQIVATTLKTEFGSAITEQYVAGLLGGFGTVGSSLSDAADGATKIADGVDGVASGAHRLATGTDQLATGLDKLASGASSAATGADTYAKGVTTYTDGVSSLSSGLAQLNTGAAGLDELESGVSTYASGVASTSAGLDQVNQIIQQYPTVDPQTKAALQQVTSGLDQLATSGSSLSTGVTQGIDGIQTGIGQSADGAAQLAAGGAQLSTGATQLASGIGDLADGARKSASGAHKLADGMTTLATGADDLGTGAHKLADGLTSGAKQTPSYTTDEAHAAAKTIATPITYASTTDNAVDSIGQKLATLLAPIGLWIGALAVFFVLAPVSRRALASTAPNRRLVLAGVTRAALVTVSQAALLVLLEHVAVGVPWSQLGATLPFALLMALAFTAFHFLLTIGLGRAGLVISLFLLAVQLTSTGGVYPIQIVAEPFQVISTFMPLTYGVSGMQAIIAGGSGGTLATACIVLAAFGLLSVLVSLAVIGRTRRAAALGLLPTPAA